MTEYTLKDKVMWTVHYIIWSVYSRPEQWTTFTNTTHQTVGSHSSSSRHSEGHFGLPVLKDDSVFCPYGAPLTPEGRGDTHLVGTGNSTWDDEYDTDVRSSL